MSEQSTNAAHQGQQRRKRPGGVVKTCPHCDGKFQVFPSAVLLRRYCSQRCMAEAYRVRMAGGSNPNHRNASSRTCARCGQAYRSYSKRSKYCGQRCYHVSRPKKEKPPPKPRRQRKPKVLKGRYFRPVKDFICVICGTAFRRRAVYEYKTCGADCLRAYQSARQRGEKSHRWQGGKTRATHLFRGSVEYSDWRRAVFSRDNYTCQMCYRRGGRLAAHHIRLFSKRPDLALIVSNGITLCWPCHQGIKGKEHLYEQEFLEITGGWFGQQ